MSFSVEGKAAKFHKGELKTRDRILTSTDTGVSWPAYRWWPASSTPLAHPAYSEEVEVAETMRASLVGDLQ